MARVGFSFDYVSSFPLPALSLLTAWKKYFSASPKQCDEFASNSSRKSTGSSKNSQTKLLRNRVARSVKQRFQYHILYQERQGKRLADSKAKIQDTRRMYFGWTVCAAGRWWKLNCDSAQFLAGPRSHSRVVARLQVSCNEVTLLLRGKEQLKLYCKLDKKQVRWSTNLLMKELHSTPKWKLPPQQLSWLSQFLHTWDEDKHPRICLWLKPLRSALKHRYLDQPWSQKHRHL